MVWHFVVGHTLDAVLGYERSYILEKEIVKILSPRMHIELDIRYFLQGAETELACVADGVGQPFFVIVTIIGKVSFQVSLGTEKRLLFVHNIHDVVISDIGIGVFLSTFVLAHAVGGKKLVGAVDEQGVFRFDEFIFLSLVSHHILTLPEHHRLGIAEHIQEMVVDIRTVEMLHLLEHGREVIEVFFGILAGLSGTRRRQLLQLLRQIDDLQVKETHGKAVGSFAPSLVNVV